MNRMIVFFAVCLIAYASLAVAATENSRGLAFGKSTATEVLEGAYQEIMWHEEQGFEVPAEMYDFYFAFEKLVHPEFYEGRNEGSDALDEFAIACPGTIVVGPESGTLVVRSCGQTFTANNNCSYPDCRNGNDVVVQMEFLGNDFITVRTAGSSFDTYLCLYVEECCGEDGSILVAANNNNPGLNYGQRLAAGISACVSPGITYYLVLDGASVAARGSYCVTIEIESNDCGG